MNFEDPTNSVSLMIIVIKPDCLGGVRIIQMMVKKALMTYQLDYALLGLEQSESLIKPNGMRQ